MIAIDFYPPIDPEFYQVQDLDLTLTYPAGELKLELPPVIPKIIKSFKFDKIIINWKYQNDTEIFAIQMLREKLNDLFDEYDEWADIDLFVPYFPHARMDRIKEPHQILALKYVYELIKNLDFTQIITLDIHSDVVEEFSGIEFINDTVIDKLVNKVFEIEKEREKAEFVFVYPDETAHKRFHQILTNQKIVNKSTPYIICSKLRDFNTGKIEGMTISPKSTYNAGSLTNPICILVDDICSYGGTFNTAIELISKEFKELNQFYLAVTHLEESYLAGKLINNEKLKGIIAYSTLHWNCNLANSEGLVIDIKE